MDRRICYPGQIPLEDDLLETNLFSMIGLAKLAEALVGTATFFDGLAVGPTAPASMQVKVSPGQIFKLENVDDTDYSSIPSDTTHQIMKQGLLMDAADLSCPAPVTSGHSINYLIQATYEDQDTDATLLMYYNSANPSQPYYGPGGNGVSNNITRKGKCTVSAKAGTSSTTGTQTTPSPDSGCVGIAVVTVAYGQTTIIAGDITEYASEPRVPQGGAVFNARNMIKQIDVSASGDVALTEPSASFPILVLTGTLTANTTLVVPNVSRQWIVQNNTSGAFNLYVSTASAGTDVLIPTGGQAINCFCNGNSQVISAGGGSGGGSSVSIQEFSFTATAGQTTFSVSYSPGTVFQVSRNGSLVEYTAATGTTVVLTDAAALDDKVVVYVAAGFSVANTYTKPEVDALLPVQATTTVAGIAEIATQPEVNAGVVANKFVSPATLAGLLNARGSYAVYTCADGAVAGRNYNLTSLVTPLTSYADGMSVDFIPSAASIGGGTATINVDGLGPKSLVALNSAGGVFDIQPKMIDTYVARAIYSLAFDLFLLVNPRESQPTAQTYTSSNLYTFAHGIGAKPSKLSGYLECLSTDQGYTAGQILEMSPGALGTNLGVQMYSDATNVYVAVGGGGIPLVAAGGGAGGSASTSSKWKIHVRAMP